MQNIEAPDARKEGLKAGLRQLNYQQLKRVIKYPGEMVLDTYNYHDGKYCPLAIGVGLDGMDNPTHEKVFNKLEELGYTVNNTKGLSGEFYTTNRKEDLLKAAKEVLAELEPKDRNSKLFFMVGLPQSGKSTWADNFVTMTSNNGGHAWPPVIVGGDDFRRAIHGTAYHPNAEGLVFSTMDIAVRALLNRGFDVIIDETCSTKETLHRYLRLDPNATPIFINTTASVCIERAKKAGKHYLVPVINRIAAQMKVLLDSWHETYESLRDQVLSRYSQDVC